MPGESVGEVYALSGSVVVISPDGFQRTLSQGDGIHQGDTVLTKGGGYVEIRFLDGSVLSQGPESRQTIDEYVYEPEEPSASKFLFNLASGLFRLVTGQIADTQPESMHISTPLGTIGIRGTTLQFNLTDPNGEEKIIVEDISPDKLVLIQDLLGNSKIITVDGGKVSLAPGKAVQYDGIATQDEIQEGVDKAPFSSHGEPDFDPSQDFVEDDFNIDQVNQIVDSLTDDQGDPLSDDAKEGLKLLIAELQGENQELLIKSIKDGTVKLELPDSSDEEEIIVKNDDDNTGDDGDNGDDGGDDTPTTISLFTDNADTINFNSISSSDYTDGTQYDAMDGDDNVTLPDTANAESAGFTIGTSFNAGAGNDTVTGGDGGDKILGGAGNDSLVGADGNDSLEGGDGADTISGDAGNDALYGQNGDDSITGGAGDDTLSGGAGADTLEGGEGADYLTGGDGNDTLSGDAGNDSLYGNAGDDQLTGGDGDDVLQGGSGADTLDGGVGDDSLSGGDDNDIMNGGDGADSLYGDAGDDSMNGDGDNDYLSGGDGADTLQGDAGNDTLEGGAGADTLEGGAGDDSLNGGDDNDSLYGGEGNDTLTVSNGDDTLNGGDGTDTASFINATSSVSVTLNSTSAQTTPFGNQTLLNIENLDGGAHNDTLIGDADNNTLWGQDGDDYLDGGANDDSLVGGDGNDTLVAGAGDDVLDGGAGTDVLSLESTTSASNVDLSLTTAQNIGSATITISNIENVDGSDTYDDTITGSDSANQLQGFAGADSLSGNDGDDTLIGGDGNDTLLGGDGDDLLKGGDGDDSIDGGAGNDTVDYSEASSSILLYLGNTPPNVTGEGNDTVTSTVENAIGSNNADTLSGDANANQFIGNDGNDYIIGQGGADDLQGGAGNDIFEFNTGDMASGEKIDGGAGTDQLNVNNDTDFSDASLSNIEKILFATNVDVTVNASDATGQSWELTGSVGSENFTAEGTSSADTVDLSNFTFSSWTLANDSVMIDGAAGNDTLTGANAASNRIEGGDGADSMTGGANTDTFYYTSLAHGGDESSHDVITSFQQGGTQDKVWLDSGTFSAAAYYTSFSSVGAGGYYDGSNAAIGSTSASIVFDTDLELVYYDSNGDNAGGQVVICELDGISSVTAADFDFT